MVAALLGSLVPPAPTRPGACTLYQARDDPEPGSKSKAGEQTGEQTATGRQET